MVSEEQKGKQDDTDGKNGGINVIRPVDLSKIMDVETHNAEKQGIHIYPEETLIIHSLDSKIKMKDTIKSHYGILPS